MQITNIKATLQGDAMTLTGEVDGVPRTAQVWKSHLDSLPDEAARIAYVVGLLAEQTAAEPVPVDLGFTKLEVKFTPPAPASA